MLNITSFKTIVWSSEIERERRHRKRVEIINSRAEWRLLMKRVCYFLPVHLIEVKTTFVSFYFFQLTASESIIQGRLEAQNFKPFNIMLIIALKFIHLSHIWRIQGHLNDKNVFLFLSWSNCCERKSSRTSKHKRINFLIHVSHMASAVSGNFSHCFHHSHSYSSCSHVP